MVIVRKIGSTGCIRKNNCFVFILEKIFIVFVLEKIFGRFYF